MLTKQRLTTYITSSGGEVSLQYGEGHRVCFFPTVSDAAEVVCLPDPTNPRPNLECTLGELRAWLEEKRAQAEAQTLALEQAPPPPAVEEELPPPPPPVADTPSVEFPDPNPSVTEPVTPAPQTRGWTDADRQRALEQPEDLDE